MMAETIFWIAIALVFFLAINVLITLEKRVVSKIEKDAKRRKMKIVELRMTNDLDGVNPFGGFGFSIGATSSIFGFGGERTFNRVLIVERAGKEEKYWVQVETTIFIPRTVKWRKTN